MTDVTDVTDVTDALHDRRRFLRTGALTIAAAQFGIFGWAHANQRVPRDVAAIADAPEWRNSVDRRVPVLVLIHNGRASALPFSEVVNESYPS